MLVLLTSPRASALLTFVVAVGLGCTDGPSAFIPGGEDAADEAASGGASSDVTGGVVATGGDGQLGSGGASGGAPVTGGAVQVGSGGTVSATGGAGTGGGIVPPAGRTCPTGIALIDDLEWEESDKHWFFPDDGTGTVTVGPEESADTRVMHSSGSGFSDWGASIGRALKDEIPCYVLSHGTGVRFRARASGPLTVRVEVPVSQVIPPVDGGNCQAECYNYHATTIEVGASWQEFTVSWSELEQDPDWGTQVAFFNTSADSIQWNVVNDGAPFELWLDDLVLLTDGEPPPNTGGTGEPGAFLATFNNTYYWLIDEHDYAGAATTTLRDSACNAVATVRNEFALDLCLEGSGRTISGATLNLLGSCSCGLTCRDGGVRCFFELDGTKPWGVGAQGNGLVPLRTWAVNNYPAGTVLYAQEFDGVAIPSVDGLGGFVHDGCFRVDDVGYGFGGNHADVFAGTAAMFDALNSLVPTAQRLTVFEGGDRCAYLAN